MKKLIVRLSSLALLVMMSFMAHEAQCDYKLDKIDVFEATSCEYALGLLNQDLETLMQAPNEAYWLVKKYREEQVKNELPIEAGVWVMQLLKEYCEGISLAKLTDQFAVLIETLDKKKGQQAQLELPKTSALKLSELVKEQNKKRQQQQDFEFAKKLLQEEIHFWQSPQKISGEVFGKYLELLKNQLEDNLKLGQPDKKYWLVHAFSDDQTKKTPQAWISDNFDTLYRINIIGQIEATVSASNFMKSVNEIADSFSKLIEKLKQNQIVEEAIKTEQKKSTVPSTEKIIGKSTEEEKEILGSGEILPPIVQQASELKGEGKTTLTPKVETKVPVQGTKQVPQEKRGEEKAPQQRVKIEGPIILMKNIKGIKEWFKAYSDISDALNGIVTGKSGELAQRIEMIFNDWLAKKTVVDNEVISAVVTDVPDFTTFVNGIEDIAWINYLKAIYAQWNTYPKAQQRTLINARKKALLDLWQHVLPDETKRTYQTFVAKNK